jgi:hypothetical protein
LWLAWLTYPASLDWRFHSCRLVVFLENTMSRGFREPNAKLWGCSIVLPARAVPEIRNNASIFISNSMFRALTRASGRITNLAASAIANKEMA